MSNLCNALKKTKTENAENISETFMYKPDLESNFLGRRVTLGLVLDVVIEHVLR